MTTIAHQGGWDEVLLVLLPIGLFAVLLFIANRRAAKLEQRDSESMPRPPDDEG